MMKKKNLVWMLTGMMVLALAGCADNPEKSVVREKNMDKMLEEAEKTDDASSYEQVKEEVKKYETYQTQIKDDNLNVTVDVDAKVEIPEVDKLSVYRVSQKKVDQKFLDTVREVLTPDMKYYDGSKTDARTKAVVARDIKSSERELDEWKKAGEDVMVEEVKERIRNLKEEYEKAPNEVKLTDFPLNNKIQKIKKLYDSNPEDYFYSWLYQLHGNGQVFYGVNDGKDGNYCSLYMHNSGDYGNCLRYDCNKSGYDNAHAIIYSADVGTDIPLLVLNEEGGKPDFSNAGMDTESIQSVKCVENEPLTLSLEDAEKKVYKFLGEIGLSDYACYEKNRYSQLVDTSDDGKELMYRDVYRFLCLRKLDNVFVNNQAGFKLTDDWQGEEYVKKMWESEAVAIAVNDSGIVDFYYLSPLSIDETVVEKSSIKSFDEIKNTFEQMVVVENASDAGEGEEKEKVSIKVTDVKLVYTRISEKDSFDTGLVVPVWDFEGTIMDEYYGKTGEMKTGNILSINAIDGSVINRQLGY